MRISDWSSDVCSSDLALQLSREIDVAYKTAWVLLMKLREAVAAERGQMQLSGIVEMDGLYIGGHVKPANRQEERVDRRLPANQSGDRKSAVQGKGVSGRVDIGGRRIIQNKRII